MTQIVAITGASGFIGSHVAPLLMSRGLRLRALTRHPEKVPKSIEIVEGELGNEKAVQALCAGAASVVHLAGAIAATSRDVFFSVNDSGTASLASAAARAGVRRFIHISSLAAREPQLSDYAASKRAGEESVMAVARPMSLAILRPPAIYGPGDRATLPLLAQLTHRIALLPGRRDARFSLLHVKDLARLIAKLLHSDWQGLAEIDDGKPGGYRWADLVAVASAIEGHSVMPVFLPRSLAIGLARCLPGTGLTVGKLRELYHPDWVARGDQPPLDGRIGFEQGFRETVAWYRTQGWLPPARRDDRKPRLDEGDAAA